MRISDWSSDVCSSDLLAAGAVRSEAASGHDVIDDCLGEYRTCRIAGAEKQDVVARRTHFLLTRNCGFAELRALDARSAAALRWRGRRFRRAAHGGRRRSPGDRLAEHRNNAKCVEGRSEEHTSELQSIM